MLYEESRKAFIEVFQDLAKRNEKPIEEGRLVPDRAHMVPATPQKYAVSQMLGRVRGKRAIHLVTVHGERKRNFVGRHAWTRESFISTVGREEAMIREHIRNDEEPDAGLEEMKPWL